VRGNSFTKPLQFKAVLPTTTQPHSCRVRLCVAVKPVLLGFIRLSRMSETTLEPSSLIVSWPSLKRIRPGNDREVGIPGGIPTAGMGLVFGSCGTARVVKPRSSSFLTPTSCRPALSRDVTALRLASAHAPARHWFAHANALVVLPQGGAELVLLFVNLARCCFLFLMLMNNC
jgi:hypothetical protein